MVRKDRARVWSIRSGEFWMALVVRSNIFPNHFSRWEGFKEDFSEMRSLLLWRKAVSEQVTWEQESGERASTSISS